MFKIRQNSRVLYQVFCVSLPAKLNRYKSARFMSDGVRLLEWPRRYQHQTKAQRCYVKRTLRTFLIFRNTATEVSVLLRCGAASYPEKNGKLRVAAFWAGYLFPL